MEPENFQNELELLRKVLRNELKNRSKFKKFRKPVFFLLNLTHFLVFLLDPFLVPIFFAFFHGYFYVGLVGK